MQIVINIPKKDYKLITEYGLHGYEFLPTVLKKGIILPKGHGRLFDERDIVNGNYEVIGNKIYELEPIIEADRSEEE